MHLVHAAFKHQLRDLVDHAIDPLQVSRPEKPMPPQRAEVSDKTGNVKQPRGSKTGLQRKDSSVRSGQLGVC